jgi:hypothetical protein
LEREWYHKGLTYKSYRRYNNIQEDKNIKDNTGCFHWVVGLICCVFVFSCDFQPTDTTTVQFDRDTFNRERALWEAQHITDYVFTEIYFPDYPAGNVRITVSGNDAISFERQDDYGSDTFSDTIFGIYNKIEKDVAFWEEQLQMPDAPYNAVCFDITYNETYHFPEEIQFAIIEPDVDGGWYNVTIEDFVTAEIVSQKQVNFDIAAFIREQKLWAE